MTEPEPSVIRAVGVTDLISHRECPRRTSYGIRRHADTGLQLPALKTPEAGSPAAAYGSASHDAFAALGEGHDDATAVQLAWDAWGRWLEPSDLELLKQDVEAYHRRDFPNTRAVLVEDEIRVPLMLPDGLAYFRGRIDRLYERLDRPGSFILVDYKSSRHARAESEIREDKQLRGYDWSLREYIPEIEELLCVYDQLRYGQVFVRFNEDQRRETRGWLVASMSSFFNDTNYQDDGLLEPRFNQWCPWCPILESCQIVPELSEWAIARIALLREGDPELFDGYAEEYGRAKGAIKVLERFVASVNEAVSKAPADAREQLRFKVSDRRNWKLSPGALARLRARVGDEHFLELVSVSKKRLESLDDDVKEWALSLMEPTAPSQVITRREPSSP